MEMEMTSTERISTVWDEIEQSESYLVSSMYEEAASSSSSALRKIYGEYSNLTVSDYDGDSELYDMMESAGMVLVQSLKELKRTSSILDELRSVFVSIEAIPVQVLLTGVCFQVSEGSILGVREFLEEFLSKWRNIDDQYYALVGVDGTLDFAEGCDSHFVMRIDKYMEVVELYAVTLLGKLSNDLDQAISWVEKAALPEEKRQGLLRRLHSLSKASNASHLQSDTNAADFSQEPTFSEESPEAFKKGSQHGESNANQTISKLTGRAYGFQWLFHNISLKLGNFRMIVSNGRIFLGFLIFLLCVIYHRKKANIQRFVRRQVLAVKKGMVDLWQLAFSYQVNPLAAVQSLPGGTR